MRREKKRDDRDFDTTQLKINQHGKMLHRDYSAHFFRWNFVRKFIKPKDTVLDVGCGQEVPLKEILFSGPAARCSYYVGVDLNPIRGGDKNNERNFVAIGEFNFVTQHNELIKRGLVPEGGFSIATHFEVFEHMLPEHGAKMLKAIHKLLQPNGTMIMSTPCYDGVRHAANHIHEYTVDELQKMIQKCGFDVEQRFGTFMDTRFIGKATPTLEGVDNKDINKIKNVLSQYYDNDALSCFFAPLYADNARNNLWVCKKR